jgi:hypothetical protein
MPAYITVPAPTVVLPSTIAPTDAGFKAWTFDPAIMVNNSIVGAGGTLNLTRLENKTGAVVGERERRNGHGFPVERHENRDVHDPTHDRRGYCVLRRVLVHRDDHANVVAGIRYRHGAQHRFHCDPVPVRNS